MLDTLHFQIRLPNTMYFRRRRSANEQKWRVVQIVPAGRALGRKLRGRLAPHQQPAPDAGDDRTPRHLVGIDEVELCAEHGDAFLVRAERLGNSAMSSTLIARLCS